MYYTLDENNNVVKCDQKGWCDLYETEDGRKKRIVANDKINDYVISTIFIGQDISFGLSPIPLLFETLVFSKGKEAVYGVGNYRNKCTTWNEAIEMHKDAIELVKNGSKYE